MNKFASLALIAKITYIFCQKWIETRNVCQRFLQITITKTQIFNTLR
jgi:hypothetical protein